MSARRFAIISLSVTGACLPLFVVRWHYGPIPTTLLELLIWITAAAYLLTLWTEKRLPRARTPLDIPIVVLLIAGAISVADAPNHTSALGIYRAYFVEAIAMFYIAYDLLRDRKDVMFFVTVMAAGAAVFAVGQIVVFLHAVATHHLNLSAAPSFLNTSPNADAFYLEPPLAFALAFTLHGTSRRERLIATGLLALFFVAMVVAFSRGSYAAMAVLAVVIALSFQNHRFRVRAIAVIAVLALISVEIPYVNRRFLTLADSVTNREGLYTMALKMLSHMPITGAGIGGYPIRVAPYRPRGYIIQIYPHDIWLTTWSELGLLGVLAFAFIFFSVLVRAARALPAATDISVPLLWGSIGTLVLILVHGLVDSPYWKNDLSVQFWLVVALQFVAIRFALPARAATERAGPPSPAPAPQKQT